MSGSVIIRKVSEVFGKKSSSDDSDGLKTASEDLRKLLDENQALNQIEPKKNDNRYSLKYNTKHRAKNKIKTKFKVGRNYFLRIKPKDGSANIIIKYQCVKTIYSVKDIEMNVVIMKLLSPFDSKKFTLDRHECEKFHIKFEPGLEVWPMEMNWIPEKKDQIPYYLYYK